MNADTIRRLNEKNELSGEACRQAMDFAAGQVKENLKEFTHSFKKAYSEEGFYRPTPNVNWTFDTVFIDEAQNIKNHGTIAVITISRLFSVFE